MEVDNNVTIDDLLDIDNNVLSTILKIFSKLNSEILYLKNHVKVKLFNSILYYEECGKERVEIIIETTTTKKKKAIFIYLF